MASGTVIQPGSWQAWKAAFRPASLPLTVGPVAVGAAMGFWRTGELPVVLTALALAAALLMQIITNLQNDIGFTARGGERVGQRIGLPRATAEGWLRLSTVRRVILGLCLLATALGLTLVVWRGWPVLAIGVASLTAALAYMGGPKPIAYTPLGELTVLLFFGLVAVLGTDWLLTGGASVVSVLAALAVGSLAAAALAVNNHRDLEHDRQVGRRTFAALFGVRASAWLLAGLLVGPFVLVLLMASAGWPLLLPWLLAPTVAGLYRDFRQCQPGPAYNTILFRVFRLELGFAVLLSAGAVLARLLGS
ncbi:1,4-dihydroxy-2-naphthoate octaprenyltransferase [Rhodoferax sp.]|uniref:1,4-dihydroxy-2-naphthoate octaprenyltransferase n=1 Tax=Rhodoferax sp. TaxID=50421 RepID=UPI0026325BCC|nr:1,4-dihydroxy-2-naphthoate octaprenyltransferase [Rhodoferax sp.]MDD2925309.1 1,4-dihydroxy-2-naphthoate octaprenyltransferase [Rhodoferax sp.]